MRRKITIKQNDAYAFDIGKNSLILIIRDTTENIMLEGDSISGVELSRSDIVTVTEYREQRVFLRNHNAQAVTVEFQLSDVPISIREQRMSINGGIVVDEIATPVEVSKVTAPISIEGVVPVTFDGGVEVSNFPNEQRVNGQVEVTNLHELQLPHQSNQVVGVGAFTVRNGQITIQANAKRVSLTIQAGGNNSAPLIVEGFLRIDPNGAAVLPASNALTVTGSDGDTFTVGEVL
ncbi:TPA: hypothetical protein ACGVAQ_003032 [Vibrio vulnificus]